ncbi:MAG: DUF222 domain-containing protein [Kineosporiaceae bacterium]|nr:DUF222 domain-containing protein [Kineosporiaceae bacterium]
MNLPEWVRDPEERALAAAIEEVAAVARISPSGLRARVEMLATWPEDHGRLYRALLEGTISTTRAREVARQTARLAAGRARDWVEQMILPVAEQLGAVGLRNRIERLIAQADAVAYRRILDDAAAEKDSVKVTQHGYGRAAITYRGSITNIADLHAALLHRVQALHPGPQGGPGVGRWGSGNGRRPRWRRSCSTWSPTPTPCPRCCPPHPAAPATVTLTPRPPPGTPTPRTHRNRPRRPRPRRQARTRPVTTWSVTTGPAAT